VKNCASEIESWDISTGKTGAKRSKTTGFLKSNYMRILEIVMATVSYRLYNRLMIVVNHSILAVLK